MNLVGLNGRTGDGYGDCTAMPPGVNCMACNEPTYGGFRSAGKAGEGAITPIGDPRPANHDTAALNAMLGAMLG